MCNRINFGAVNPGFDRDQLLLEERLSLNEGDTAINQNGPDTAVVVLGSLHYDVMVEAPHRPVKGETVTGSRWYPKFGGKGGNQAVAAKMHGANVRLIGATGTDNFADYIHARLKQAHISSDHVARLNSVATGMSVAIQDADGDYGAVIVSGANLFISPDAIENPDVWKDAGVLLLQNEVPESLNFLAANKARSLNMTVCLNAAPMRDMSPEFLALVDVLIVNAIEAEALGCGAINTLPAAAVAAQTLSQRFPCAIVTAGSEGVAACSSTAQIQLAARPVEVVSTHGAGDVFCGVLCAELAANTALDAATKIANNAAADHVAEQ